MTDESVGGGRRGLLASLPHPACGLTGRFVRGHLRGVLIVVALLGAALLLDAAAGFVGDGACLLRRTSLCRARALEGGDLRLRDLQLLGAAILRRDVAGERRRGTEIELSAVATAASESFGAAVALRDQTVGHRLRALSKDLRAVRRRTVRGRRPSRALLVHLGEGAVAVGEEKLAVVGDAAAGAGATVAGARAGPVKALAAGTGGSAVECLRVARTPEARPPECGAGLGVLARGAVWTLLAEVRRELVLRGRQRRGVELAKQARDKLLFATRVALEIAAVIELGAVCGRREAGGVGLEPGRAEVAESSSSNPAPD